MSESDEHRRAADKLLTAAATTTNMGERSRLIEEAMREHRLAMDAAGHGGQEAHDNDDRSLSEEQTG